MNQLAIGHPRPGPDAGQIARRARGELRALGRPIEVLFAGGPRT